MFNPAHPEFWVLVSFIGFVLMMMYFGVPKLIGNALDARADAIRKELDDARKLREEAQQLLADYQKKSREAEDEAKSIIDQARREAEALAADTRKNLAEQVARRSKIAEEKIARAEAQALSEVRGSAIDAAMAAAEKILATRLQASGSDPLLAQGLADIKRKLN